ncbi:uncharacterized protein HGUI_00116 [Hanseniaspora guilliermondii]|uniref:DUF3835 domain-containing protein n=1 Tax=Hanseniaspora guilliermondii TaxID=56406 RepID=A0A1L0AW74_9ASCO|nr:uncharacterized protein HGUI_00116 [Hanseniaspora guilliermondii]
MDNDILTFTELMEKRQRDGTVENINAITKTTDDSKYLTEQYELYNELIEQLKSELELSNQNDFIHPNSIPDDDVIDDGRVVGEFIISESHIFRNIGMDLFIPMETSPCIDFLKDRLVTMKETEFILENKLNNLVRNLKISYSILDPDLKDLADACIEHNNLQKMFNEDILIEKNLQTGDLMPAGIITGDDDYVFNDEYGIDNNDPNGIMEIVEELDNNGNTIVSKVLQANDITKIKQNESKQGKNYKKNKKKRDRLKAKKQRIKQEQQALDAQLKEVKEMNEQIKDQKEPVHEDSSTKDQKEFIPDIPIIKEVDLKDIKILGPKRNLESGNVEVPEYLKHTNPNKPAIAKEDLLDMNDLVAALEDMEVVDEELIKEEEDDDLVTDVTESDMILQDIHYDYEKLNKYLVEDEEEINLNFDEEDLYDESEFDVSKIIAESKTDSLSNRFEKFTKDINRPRPSNDIDYKPILKKNIGSTVINTNKQTKKTVSFANNLQIKEFENHKLFNRKNTFSNMAYYMYLDQSIEIEMDEVTISNTNKNKAVNENGDEEEELQTECLDISEVDDILSDTVKKLTGEDTIAMNDIIEKEIPEVVEEVVTPKKKMSRFKKESRRGKRNSLIFTESSEFNVFTNDDDQNVTEELVIEKDVILEHSDSNIYEEDEEGDESFNTLYQRSLEKTDSYFTEEELDEGREYAQNVILEHEEDYDEDDEEDLGPVDEDEYEAQKQNNEEKKKEEDDLQEILNKPYEFPEELIKAINEDKNIEVIQEPKVDYSQFRTTDEMAEAYNLGLYDDDKDEFTNKNYQRVEGMAIDYTDDTHKGYIIEHLEDFKGYNEQVEILKDDIAEFIHNTQNLEKQVDPSENDEGNEVMADIVEHDIEFTNEDEDEDEMNYFHVNDLNDDYRLDEDVLREDISKEYQRLKQKIIKMQKSEEVEKLKNQEEAVNDVLENEDPRQFEPLDEVGNPIKKSRFKQQRIKMNM